MKSLLLGISIVGLLIVSVAAADGYHLLRKMPIPGDGSWDYLTIDASARRIYVSHSSLVHVVDADSGAILGSIPSNGAHGIALSEEFDHGFITNGSADNVTMFSLTSQKSVASIPTGKKPDAIVYDDATKRVFANNGGSGSSTVINAVDGRVLGTVDLGGGPESSVADGKGFVFTNIEDKNEVVRIDAAHLNVTARWTLGACEQPSALAMNRSGRRLFVGCRNHVMAMVDADTGAVILTRTIGDHVDAAAFDAQSAMVFLSNGDGTVDVFHQEASNTLGTMETIQTQQGSKTMALDSSTHRLFLSAADYIASDAKDGRSIKPGSFGLLVFGN